MKRFTYVVRRRYCPSCGGDGKGRIFPSSSCWRCLGDGHLPEQPEPGEAHLVMVHDQSGKIVEIRPVAGRQPGYGPDSIRMLVIGIVALVLISVLLYEFS